MWYYLLSSRNVWSIKPHRKPLFSFKKEKEKKKRDMSMQVIYDFSEKIITK